MAMISRQSWSPTAVVPVEAVPVEAVPLEAVPVEAAVSVTGSG
jgi:hypothetical protein